MNTFHHLPYRQHNSKKMFLNETQLVSQNSIFFKNEFNKKYVKFSINIMKKIVFCKYYIHHSKLFGC